MPRFNYVPRPAPGGDFFPFSDAAQAWFWYARSQQARRDGARFESGAGTARRPCEPDDIYLAVRGLYRQGALTAAHLRVLARYGRLERPPDPRLVEERRDLDPWNRALAALDAVLRTKGIVR